MEKTVLYPVEVPDGKFCWEHSGSREICGYFDNEGGHSKCELVWHWDLKDTKEGVLKAPECEALKEPVISTSPDLLKACKNALDIFEGEWPIDDEVMGAVMLEFKALINKADDK